MKSEVKDMISISAGSLGQLAVEGFCPRCFWIQINIKPFEMRMPGIFSSIDSYIKYVVHTHFDKKGCLPDWFPENDKITKIVYPKPLHHSRYNIRISDVILDGVPDDVFLMKDGGYFIVDYKTARFTKKQEGLIPQFEVQLNCYAYIAEKNPQIGLKPVEYLSLIFLEPQSSQKFIPKDDLIISMIKNDSFLLKFIPKEKKVKKDFELVEELVKEAEKILKRNTPPNRLKDCKNCDKIDELTKKLRDSENSY